MPFSVPVPFECDSSFDVSPVENSMLGISYNISCSITENPSNSKQKKKSDNQGSPTTLISESVSVKIIRPPSIQPHFNKPMTQQFQEKGGLDGLKKLVGANLHSNFSITATPNTNLIIAGMENFFQVKLDNSEQSAPITRSRISLTRTVTVKGHPNPKLKVAGEEIAAESYKGANPKQW